MEKYKQRQILTIEYQVNWKWFDEKDKYVADMKTVESGTPTAPPRWPCKTVKVKAEWKQMIRRKGDGPDKWTVHSVGSRWFVRG